MVWERLEELPDRGAVREAMQAVVGAADQELILAAPGALIDDLSDTLGAALDRGVTVAVMRYDDGTDPVDYDGIATVVRECRTPITAVCVGDYELGVTAHLNTLLTGEGVGVAFERTILAKSLVAMTLGNNWPHAEERFVADGHPLPRTYDGFRSAVVRATLALRREEPVRVRATVEPTPANDAVSGRREIQGRLANARQSFVYPITCRFPGEVGLELVTDEGRRSVGGTAASSEDYRALETILEPA